MKILTFALAVAVGLTVVAMETATAASRCAAIDDPKRLLRCYNELSAERGRKLMREAKKNKSPYELISSSADSRWQLTATGLTEKGWQRLNLRVYAKNFWVRSKDKGEAERLKDLRPSVWIRCIKGRMSGFMNWGLYLDVGKAKITYRFDLDRVQTALAPVSKDHKRIAPLSEKHLMARIEEMFGKRRLIARVTPKGEKPLAVEFDVSGLETAIKPLRRACNW